MQPEEHCRRDLRIEKVRHASDRSIDRFDDTGHREPVGTGPWKFVEWRRDQLIRLEAFEQHWRGKPAFKNLVIRAIPEIATQVAEMKTGGVDLIRNVSADLVPELKDHPRTYVSSSPILRVHYVQLDMRNAPMDNKLVRQSALAGLGRMTGTTDIGQLCELHRSLEASRQRELPLAEHRIAEVCDGLVDAGLATEDALHPAGARRAGHAADVQRAGEAGSGRVLRCLAHHWSPQVTRGSEGGAFDAPAEAGWSAPVKSQSVNTQLRVFRPVRSASVNTHRSKTRPDHS